ncbi:ABC transporter ATP-binding protein [Telmatospirillum siberiense]|uniref:Dipeptide ABC transporter ATP-binding protein DppD n=1 Tax=Telmatospirillum siberiense TaxID=382514 RepID=A0A2N3PYP3_9PROT|nr:ABC transporter ATP-binding protein [Telmatospirillum siberiense]PKU25513.1 dipeptide ABC transporter ATP-binding protein DppD [Telmatospirillum siberiense]
MSNPLISVSDLTVTFGGSRPVHAVNGVSFTVGTGEVLGLLGESGCGKSVTLRSLLRLHPPRRTTYGGRIEVDGHDILSMSEEQLRRYRGSVTSMIFQEPLLAFDPVYSIGRQISEAIRRHRAMDGTAAEAEAIRLLDRVQIPQAARRYHAYPHEMSGGMRQRAMIALALSCRPKLLLADEPTTALDATVQIQILLLLRELQREMGLSIIFVTHDIGVAVEISDRVAVMYAGRIIEEGPIAGIIGGPAHPYTRGLLASTVTQNMRGTRLEAIPGAPPDLADLPPGCAFAPRCSHASATCLASIPAYETHAGRGVACFHSLNDEGVPPSVTAKVS